MDVEITVHFLKDKDGLFFVVKGSENIPQEKSLAFGQQLYGAIDILNNTMQLS